MAAVIAGRSSYSTWPTLPPTTDDAAADCVGVANDSREFALWLSPHILTNTARVLTAAGVATEVVEEYVAILAEIADASDGGVRRAGRRDAARAPQVAVRKTAGMCTVLVRYAPGGRWPLLLAAVRDEFVERAWDPPGRHWPGAAAGLVGGRDRVAGGTWLAADPARPAVAAVLNGVRLPEPAGGARPSRGGLPLAALTGGELPDLTAYDGVHVLRGTLDRLELWTWDGVAVRHRELAPGEHIVVNDGVDLADQPLIAHFRPRLAAAAEPDPRPGLPPGRAWGDWLCLLAGDGLDPADPRAVIVRREFEGRSYGSTSATLVALGREAVRYDFTATPGSAARWTEVTW